MKTIWIAVLIWVAAAPISAQQKKSMPAEPSAAPTFEGLWTTTYGTMRLACADSTVSGTYSLENGSSNGITVAGGTIDVKAMCRA